MPNSPHSSWNLSSSSSMGVASADISLKATPPRARDPIQLQVHQAPRARPDPEPIAPDPSDEAPLDPELLHQLLEVLRPIHLHRNQHPRRSLPEQGQIGRAAGRAEGHLPPPPARAADPHFRPA